MIRCAEVKRDSKAKWGPFSVNIPRCKILIQWCFGKRLRYWSEIEEVQLVA